jgi:hypothetical protein
MDEARTIRFYVAPVLFLMSVVWGAWFDYPTKHQLILDHLKVENLPNLIGLAAGGGFVVFAFGYIIGTLTYAILRLLFCLKAWCCGGSRYHEAGFALSDLKNIWKKTGHPGADDPQQELWKQEISAVVVFDFGIIRANYEGVHQWLVRRWNAVSIGATSVVGLLLSFPIGRCVFCISFSWAWCAPVMGLIVACFYVAYCAWGDGRRMVSFMAQMPDALLSQKRPYDLQQS